MGLLHLQEQSIGELLESAPDEWARIEVRYERYAWGGETSEIYVANGFVGDEKTDLDLTLEAPGQPGLLAAGASAQGAGRARIAACALEESERDTGLEQEHVRHSGFGKMAIL